MTAQQLKNSILQMAVQGKLVPQDPNDEPASVLLERIRAEKERLIKEKKIKREKNPSVIFKGADNTPYEKIGKNEPICIADDVPFEIPDSWEWTRLESISILIGNKNNQILTKDILPKGKIPVVSQGKLLIDGYCNEEERKISILPLVMFGDHTRNVKYVDFEFVIGADGTKFHKILSCNPEYIYYWMLYAAETLRNRGYARHYSLLKECFVPIPPIEEQLRIVTKIRTLLPLIEKYEDIEFSRNLLDSNISNQLKKSILQEAVQGKLVPQDPSDEPAEALLERIRAEKQRLIKEGKIKKDKHESVIFRRDNSHYEKLDGVECCIDDEIPFEIPDSWEWTRLGTVIELQSGQDMTPDKYNDCGKGIPYITGASNIENGSVLINRWTEYGRAFACCGDILLTCKGTVGTMAVLQEPQVHIARQIMAIRPIGELYVSYIQLVLDTLVENLKAAAKSMIPGIAREDVLHSLFPVPPVSEQQRIVQRIEELLPLVKEL